MKRICLNGQWTVQNPLNGKIYPATIPGDIHHDLVESGVIEDPYYSDNSLRCGWVTEQDWLYEKKFNVTDDMLKNNIMLNFDGIDTFSEVFVNGQKLGDTINMFLKYEYAIKEYLKVGENTLTIRLISIKAKACGYPEEGYFGCFNVQRIFIRKAQCHFSWDWAPNFPAMGIWQDVYLEVLNGHEIKKVMIKPYLNGVASFFVHLSKDLPDNVAGKELKFKIYDETQTVEKTFPVNGVKNAFNITVPNVKLWWPYQMGEPHLYNYEISLIEDGVVTYEKKAHFGFRTVEQIQDPLSDVKFLCEFKINDTPVFLKGANWVPLDIMTGSITEEKYRTAINMAKEANFTSLRIWGGGIYEKDIFYDICDEVGLLVWQDFQFACSDIPDDYEDFADRVIEEAEYQIARLHHHPSLFTYSGGNEKTGSFGKGKSRGDKTAYYTLRGMVGHLDMTRPYLPSSPYGFTDEGNALFSGDSHVNSYQSARRDGRMHEFREVLKNLDAMMSSEIAVQGSSRLEGLKQFIPADKLWPVNDIYDLHFTKNPYDGTGTTFVEQQVEAAGILFGKFDNLAEFVKKSMALHSEFIKADAEFHRARKGRCWGAMFWMFSDIWPSGTWAMVDYYLLPKAAYYSAKRAYEPLAVIMTKVKEVTGVYVVNDYLKDFKGKVTVSAVTASGDVVKTKTYNVNATANTSVFVADLADMIDYGSQNILHASFETVEKTVDTYFYPDLWKDIAWKNPNLDVKVEKKCSKCATVTVTAIDAFARMVNFEVPVLIGTTFSDNFFDLAKGMSKTVTIKCKDDFDVADVKVKTWLEEWR